MGLILRQVIKTFILLGLFIVVACVPEKKGTKCGELESFSSSLRRCIQDPDLANNHQPLIGSDQAYSMSEETTQHTGIVLNAASDQDSDDLQYILLTSPASGYISNCMGESGSSGPTDRTCTYNKPDTDFSGTVTFTYKVFDGKEYSVSPATVTITVTPYDDNPTFTGGSTITGLELDTATSGVTYYSTGIMYLDEGGGTDEDSDELCVSVVSNSTDLVPQANIRLNINSGSNYETLSASNAAPVGDGASSGDSYTVAVEVTPRADRHNSNVTGTASLTITVYDGGYNTGTGTCSGNSQAFTHFVSITAVNDDPVITTISSTSVGYAEAAALQASIISFTVDEGGTSNGDANTTGSDEDSDALTIKVCSVDSTSTSCSASGTGSLLIPHANIDIAYNGGISENASSADLTTQYADPGDVQTGNFVLDITPDADAFGTAYIRVEVSDGVNATITQIYTVTITGVEDDPTITLTTAPTGSCTAGDFCEDESITLEAQTLAINIDEGGGTWEDSQTMSFIICNADGAVAPVACAGTGSTAGDIVPASGISVYYGSTFAGATLLGAGDAWLTVDNSGDENTNKIFVKFDSQQNYNGQVSFYMETKDSNSPTSSTVNTNASYTWESVNDAPTFELASPSSGAIQNQITNHGTTLDAISLTIDEGGLTGTGNGGDEDTQELCISITSSNTSLVAHNATNLKVTYNSNDYPNGGTITNIYGGVYGTFTDVNTDLKALSSLSLYIKPVPGQTGTSTISITLKDDSDGDSDCATVAADVLTYTASFDVTVTDVVATHNGWDDVISIGRQIAHDGSSTVLNNGSITLKWNAITLSSTTYPTYAVVSGYNIYRSKTGASGTYTNIGSTAAAVTTYEDTSLDQVADQGKAMWYIVKALDSSSSTRETDSTEAWSKLRVIFPPENMALVHRRIANKTMCTKLGSTSDKTNHNRCSYNGAEATEIASSFYYDLGQDVLVDQVEAGCPYTIDGSSCMETGNGGKCIGLLNETETCQYTSDCGAGTDACKDHASLTGAYTPNGNAFLAIAALAGNANSVYWDSVGKKCYKHNGATWDHLPIGDVTSATGSIYYSRDSGQCWKSSGTTSLSWDLLGCPYDRTIANCDGTIDGCRQALDPTTDIIPAAIGVIFYDTSNNKCYRSVGTNAIADWEEIGDVVAPTALALPNLLHMPPMVNMSQNDAESFCNDDSISITDNGTAIAASSGTRQLLSRQQQVAASLWDEATYNDSQISALEAGTSLSTTTSQCNSTSGGALTFKDDQFPPPTAESIDTLPSSLSNPDSLRILRTGSTVTASCKSRWGLQDMVGNVREWTTNFFSCTDSSGFTCPTSNMTVKGTSNNYQLQSGALADGPFCVDSNTDTFCDAHAGETSLTGWTLDSSTTNGATHFHLAAGLPSNNNISLSSSQLAIGSGISTAALHGDKFTINAKTIYDARVNDGDQNGYITFGGHYADGSAGGMWSLEALDKDLRDEKTGFRCAIPVNY